MSHLFCFGLGYSSSVVAKRLAAERWTITGTSTRLSGAARLSQLGLNGLVFDGTRPSPEITAALRDATHVLLSIPPGAAGDPAFLHHAADIASSHRVRWIGYFSTVGVYGDAAGGWVDEETPAVPKSERGQRRLSAETAWLGLGHSAGKVISVLRLPGIYGPGRSVIEELREGTARRLIKPGQVFNRIHVDDIATVTLAAMRHGSGQRVYNVTDDEPAPPQDVVVFGAQLLGVPPPPEIDFATADLSPMARSFYSESKRVANARMKRELGVTLAYPSYREGLTAIARAGPTSGAASGPGDGAASGAAST